MSGPSERFHTAGGIFTLLLWSTAVGVTKDVMDQVGGLTAAALIYGLAGVAGCIWLLCSQTQRRRLPGMPLRFWLVCGGIFVVYVVVLNRALGIAGRDQAVEIGLINYLWPATTLLFSIPVLGCRARWRLWPGMLLAVAGVWLVMAGPAAFADPGAAAARLAAVWFPCLLAFIAAILWGLYSALCRRWPGSGGNGVPIFMLATAAALGAQLIFNPERSQWSAAVACEILYMAILPGIVAYALWENAMRSGRMVFLASLSYFVPLASTVTTCLWLGTPLGWTLLAGAGLVTAGALLCKTGVVEPEAAASRVRAEAEAVESLKSKV